MRSKAELHLHLEGAMPPGLCRDLAGRYGVDLSGIFDEAGGYRYEGFADFLRVYEVATSVLRRPEDFAELTTAVLEAQAAHGVIYTEAFLSPDFCGGRDPVAWGEYLSAIEGAAEAAAARHGIVMRGIVTCIRHFGPEAAVEAAGCAAGTAGRFVTGFGMGGAETAWRPGDFAPAFDLARGAGLGLTCHAGEWVGPEGVAETLDALGVSRIGHGVRAVEDPALVERLAREGIVLEVCPGSNVSLGVYPNLRAHPIEALRLAGVPVTVSTDDPPFFDTDMTAEYDGLSAAFGWDDLVWNAIDGVAMRAAFCDADTKAEVMKRIGAWTSI